MEKNNFEIMSCFAVTENVPAIEFCGQFVVPITSWTFVLSIINAIESKNYLAITGKSHKKLELSLVEHDYHNSLEQVSTHPSKEIVGITYDRMFMGYTDLEQLLIAFKKIKAHMLELKHEKTSSD